VGGLVGENYGNLINCFATGSSSGNAGIGGLVGNNYDNVTNCFATGSSSGNACVAGLVGWNIGNITNCFATSPADAEGYVGGLVGYNFGLLTSCYAASPVSGYDSVGGLVGWNEGSLTSCFWDVNASGTTDGVANMDPDPIGAAGKTTTEMQMRNTFTDAGWDFVGEVINGPNDIWDICEGTNCQRMFGLMRVMVLSTSLIGLFSQTSGKLRLTLNLLLILPVSG
jgi:hypothetical protein